MFLAPLPAWVPVSQPFRPGQHFGIDWASPLGTPIVAAEAGWVRYIADEAGGYGNTITLEHADGWESRYAHMQSMELRAGETVTRGTLVGYTGGMPGAPGAGNTTGPHLHSELRQWGVAVDPLPLLTWSATDSGGAPLPIGDDVTEEQMATLAGWMQEQSALMLDTLIGPGWQGRHGVLGAWHNDTRSTINAHTSATIAGASATAVGATALELEAAAEATAAEADALAETTYPLELAAVGTDAVDDDGIGPRD